MDCLSCGVYRARCWVPGQPGHFGCRSACRLPPGRLKLCCACDCCWACLLGHGGASRAYRGGCAAATVCASRTCRGGCTAATACASRGHRGSCAAAAVCQRCEAPTFEFVGSQVPGLQGAICAGSQELWPHRVCHQHPDVSHQPLQETAGQTDPPSHSQGETLAWVRTRCQGL